MKFVMTTIFGERFLVLLTRNDGVLLCARPWLLWTIAFAFVSSIVVAVAIAWMHGRDYRRNQRAYPAGKPDPVIERIRR
jgi:hypothetical protein